MADTGVLLRWVLIIFMAFFLAIMLESQDRNARLAAAVFLIVFAQIREISLVNDASGPVPSKKNAKKFENERSIAVTSVSAKKSHVQPEQDKELLRGFANSWLKNRQRAPASFD